MRIVADKITFTYNRKSKFATRALDEVSLEIAEGDFLGIIGHTGSGKSTFIQHLNGLIPVESGRLTVGETDLSAGVKKNKKQLKNLRSRVGMVFQYPEYQLFEQTVFDDVAFGYKNFFPEADKEEIKAAVLGALDLVGLDRSVANRSPFDLSGGQKRRVAIAGVIVTKPEILILDEPVAGLDPLGKNELMALLHRLHKTSCKTIIMVSHDMDEVADNCNKVAVFSEGKIIKVGSPKEVFNDYEGLTALRLDVPVTEYIALKLKEKGVYIDTDFSSENFVKKLVDFYKNVK
ncbi:MAG: energy-coupling factor transporter ATPase [Clostridia bacterium]|nr:energy-coupling factor transporter ATPase [Clostridia bacterium]